MAAFCNTCGQIPPDDQWDNPWTCKPCGEGYDEFEQALDEGRVEVTVPENPQVGDVIDIKIRK